MDIDRLDADRIVRWRAEGVLPARGLRHDHPQRPPVGGRGDVAHRRFRGRIPNGAVQRGGHPGSTHNLRSKTEIRQHQFERAGASDEDVIRFDIAVNQRRIEAMQVDERRGDLPQDGPDHLLRRAAGQQVRQGSGGLLHHFIDAAVGDAAFELPDDVACVQPSQQLDVFGLGLNSVPVQFDGHRLSCGLLCGKREIRLTAACLEWPHIDEAFGQRGRQLNTVSRGWRVRAVRLPNGR